MEKKKMKKEMKEQSRYTLMFISKPFLFFFDKKLFFFPPFILVMIDHLIKKGNTKSRIFSSVRTGVGVGVGLLFRLVSEAVEDCVNE